jgi:curved DNA-binding protein CbpA
MEPRLLPYSPERDVYQLLQVDPAADSDEVVAACRRLARTFHPDFNGSPRATQEMQVVNAVRDLLTDPMSRAVYDANRRRYLADSRAALIRAVPPQTLPRRASARPLGPGLPRALPSSERVADELRRTARTLLAALRAILAAFEPERCPDCRSPILAEYRFCGGCGRSLERPRLPGPET